MIQQWRCRNTVFELGSRALVMGIVNVTPDSFSDGGRLSSTQAAVEHALRLASEGADILDIGGESSRPGADIVPVDEELRRVIPVVREITQRIQIPISVDTVKSEVARQAIDAGACIINDITALGDPDMVHVARESGAGVILMHMQGTPATMQRNPSYQDVVAEVGAFLEERLKFACDRGINPLAVALDPGIGFGKTNEHSLQLLRHLEAFQRIGRPVCLGVSRKGLIGKILNQPLENRVIGSVAIACFAIARSAAQIVRVHDVAAHRDAVNMLAELKVES